ncbi:hypothetical protein D4L85_03150 [Chryseolinea soli]|uniref:Uncharacterized protein n=1 Tax=Chryseolinea soli TaxID=2321403 RepID=A0A385SGQ3_9BACT|nr:hypothetical protein D4L85_03150 [Chryseolinea soli]
MLWVHYLIVASSFLDQHQATNSIRKKRKGCPPKGNPFLFPPNPTPARWLLATGYWLLATGYWLLTTGY